MDCANNTIVIDAGHGGADAGTMSSNYYTEKEMNLKITLEMMEILIKKGYRVIPTRMSDKTLPKDERLKIINDANPILCVSNHINASGGTGAEVIHSIHDSSTLSDIIIDKLESYGRPRRRVFTRKNDKGEDYYFIIRDTRPIETVIIEYGFADNPKDDRDIMINWHEYAEASAIAIDEYIKLKHEEEQEEVKEQWEGQFTGINWIYGNNLLVSDKWREKPFEPLPFWAQAILLKRQFRLIKNALDESLMSNE